MPELPRVTAKDIVRILGHRGFSEVRQSGSHKIFRNAEGSRATVPVHGSKILHPKILKNIIRDANITVEKLRELL